MKDIVDVMNARRQADMDRRARITAVLVSLTSFFGFMIIMLVVAS